jgi:hypothetical protein
MIVDKTTGLRIMTKEEYEKALDDAYDRGVSRGKFEYSYELIYESQEKIIQYRDE